MFPFLLFTISTYLQQSSSYLPSTQISALNDLYESLQGDKWTACRWNLTLLATENTLDGPYCGLVIDSKNESYHQQTITHIAFNNWNDLNDNNLNGTLSPSISELTDLTEISIEDNPLLSGTIPNSLCKLKHLQSITFKNADLSGNVPECIGNISSLRGLELQGMPTLSMSDSIIKSLCNHSYLYSLQFVSINYTGCIPECIGYNFSEIEWIIFKDLPKLNSSIPDSFNNLKKLWVLQLSSIPYLHGTLPSDIFKNKNLWTFDICNTSISGNIPNSLEMSINLLFFRLRASSSIYGTIPESICYLKNLFDLEITETSITGSIPKCISTDLTNLVYLDLHSNNLNGEVPWLPSSHIKVFDVHNNKLIGSISSIFPLQKYPNLEIVALHKNNLYDNNIGVFLKKIFIHSKGIQSITIYDNQYVGGQFPQFSEKIHLRNLSVFAAHNLDVGGIIPNNVYFGNGNISTFILSIYGNKLSSKLPTHLINTQNTTPIVLTGNLFTIYDNDDIPNWMDESQFIDAEPLYLTISDFIQNWLVLIVAFICCILAIIKMKYRFIKYTDVEFIINIKKIDKYLCDYKLLIVVISLLIFYPFSCSYYSSSPVLSYFSLFFFESNKVYINIILYLLIMIYNIITINMVIQIIKKTLANTHKIKHEFDTAPIQVKQIFIQKHTDIQEKEKKHKKKQCYIIIFNIY